MKKIKIENIIHNFNSITANPAKYLSVQRGVKKDIKKLVKSLYHIRQSQEKGTKTKKLASPEIIVKNFDEEQIWQQIELQNTDRWDELVWNVANCISSKTNLTFPTKTTQPKVDARESDLRVDEVDTNLRKIKRDKSQSRMKKQIKLKPKTKTSIVDDNFFNVEEMEKFLKNEEKMEAKGNQIKNIDSDEDSIDMFEDIDDKSSNEKEEKINQYKYSDFYDDKKDDLEESGNDLDYNEPKMAQSGQPLFDSKPIKKKVRFAIPESYLMNTDEATEESVNKSSLAESEIKSGFEMRQQRLQQKIAKLEEKSLTEAPWQLKGEVDATKRPQNSLLEEVVDFDLTTRPIPVITEQTTLTLEELIKRRIKDKAWDDVVKKEKPIDTQLTFRKSQIFDQIRAKESLAQVYEMEYLKEKNALSGMDEEEKELQVDRDVKDEMKRLFSKLNTLCNFHYTPEAPYAEVRIISNTPAISMEEVAPVATSHATLLAPEEVKMKHRGDLMSKAERKQTDKNRERRKKKKLQKQKGKIIKIIENRNTTKGVKVNDKAIKTSNAFFKKLNDDVTVLIKSKSKKNVKN